MYAICVLIKIVLAMMQVRVYSDGVSVKIPEVALLSSVPQYLHYWQPTWLLCGCTPQTLSLLCGS